MGRRLSIVNGSGTVGPSTYAIKTSMNFNPNIYIYFLAKMLNFYPYCNHFHVLVICRATFYKTKHHYLGVFSDLDKGLAFPNHT